MKSILAACAVMLGLILFTRSNDAAATVDKMYIQRFDELENVELDYHYPDFEHPIFRLYSSERADSLVFEADASQLTRFTVLNIDPAQEEDDQTTIKQNTYKKKIVESITHKGYIVSIAMLHQDNNFIYGNFKDDLLLWKEYPEGYRLVAIYPECVGGCLFCGTEFTNYAEDTIQVEFTGKGLGEEWGGKTSFYINDNQLHFFKNERFRRFVPTRDRCNPIADATSWVIEEYYYDKRGRQTDEKINFDARNADGTPVRLTCLLDSLGLYEASVNFSKKPLHLSTTVPSLGTEFRVGPILGNLISVSWQGKWYLTPKKYFAFPTDKKG